MSTEPEVPADPFAEPFVDVDEWRSEPVRHRYVHGGFAGHPTRISIYLPPADRYEGRFFQHLTPVPAREDLAERRTGEEDLIGFAVDSGAYLVETNGGGPPGGGDPAADPTAPHAAAARLSRPIAEAVYGPHRPYGYAFGGSGGGYRTIAAAETTTGVWDGFVPYVIGSPMAIPSCFTVRMHAQRILRHRLDDIVDALEPGGSGDPYLTLDDEERAALLEATRMGFPPRSWFGHRTMGMHAFPALYDGLRRADPGYFEEFWTEPGYLGHDAPHTLERDTVRQVGTITGLLSASEAAALGLHAEPDHGPRDGVDRAWREGGHTPSVPIAVRLSNPPSVDVLGADLVVASGSAAGARITVLHVVGDVAVLAPTQQRAAADLRVGDDVELDNRAFVAAQTYHRHQVPGPEYTVWDQLRHEGSPIHPQRPMLLGPLFAAAATGCVQTGRFDGRMIVVACLLDREAFPWQADWYRARVREHLGEEVDDRFRLWYVDNALHGDDEVQEDPTRSVSYLGVLHQALRDLSAWVERGDEPLPSTHYEVVDGQVVVPADATSRRGVQPVVDLTVDGGQRADVAVGQEVVLRAVANVPPGAGVVTEVEWDVDGGGELPVVERPAPATAVEAERRCSFAAPGTFFPAVRVTARRSVDREAIYARLRDVARVRVVVR